MTVAIDALLDEVFRLGGSCQLENNNPRLRLPVEARWLLEELRRRRAELVQECQRRWLKPGVPAKEWFKSAAHA